MITDNFADLSSYYGLVKCTIVPHRGLLCPVIPATINGKLYFSLCRTCAGEKKKGPCSHSEQQRALSGTWCTPELTKAVDLGYKVSSTNAGSEKQLLYQSMLWFQITQIVEVWHFPQTTTGLFLEYINKFLKIKYEASGWPKENMTQQEKDAYIQEIWDREGIRLDPSAICKNPGLRQVAKLCLNSLWGRLGMKEDRSHTEYVREPARFFELLCSGSYKVTSFDEFTDDVMAVEYKVEEGFREVNTSTNVVIAAFTTCLARLHLFQYMEKLGKQLLYFDTDSIVFSHRPGQYMPPTGNFLGDLESELEAGDFIVSFGSLGPKCYGYVTKKGKTCIKIKGHSINGETSGQLNFETLMRLLSDDSVELIKYSNVLKRNKKTLSIFQTDLTKAWRVTYEKRYICNDAFETLPYGY